MANLIIGNSYSQITGLTPEQWLGLVKAVSYNYRDYQGRIIERRLVDTRGNFPSGLLERAVTHCELNFDSVAVEDTRVRPGFTIKFDQAFIHTPYDDQLAAVKAALCADRGILSLPTGTGKSFVIALLIASMGLRTLVVVPTIELRRQLKETIAAVLGEKALNHIEVEHIGAARLSKLNNFDMLIIDECHHAAARTYRKLNKSAWKNIYFRYCFTATPFRSREEEQILMESVTGPVLYELTYAEALSKGYIVPVEAYYVDLPKTTVEGYTWKAVYNELIVNNEERNREIAMLLANLHAKRKPTLCLVKEIAHGDNIVKLTGAGFANGVGGEAEGLIKAFNDRKIGVLVGTTGVLGEGVDTRPAEYVVIAGLGKSRNAFMQQVGRAVRRYPGKESAKVIIFRDKSHKWTLSHFNQQRNILREYYGVEPVKL